MQSLADAGRDETARVNWARATKCGCENRARRPTRNRDDGYMEWDIRRERKPNPIINRAPTWRQPAECGSYKLDWGKKWIDFLSDLGASSFQVLESFDDWCPNSFIVVTFSWSQAADVRVMASPREAKFVAAFKLQIRGVGNDDVGNNSATSSRSSSGRLSEPIVYVLISIGAKTQSKSEASQIEINQIWSLFKWHWWGKRCGWLRLCNARIGWIRGLKISNESREMQFWHSSK